MKGNDRNKITGKLTHCGCGESLMLMKKYFELSFKIYELYLPEGGLGHF